ncbi:hypothetical protein D915_011021 [Fasciola hepatica]|uniref:Uncharacterized protein n=1 Tax=Fasciola hepatica TaxID=6192 RepID=A0A4E0QV29_FASHE|nr:hypothetical protein D915_011021 [Fasciola hepatica]
MYLFDSSFFSSIYHTNESVGHCGHNRNRNNSFGYYDYSENRHERNKQCNVIVGTANGYNYGISLCGGIFR